MTGAAPAGGWTTGTIIELDHPTDRLVRPRFHVEDRVDHLPGQHYVVRLRAPDGYTAQRSYSVASDPDDPLLELMVECLPGGEVSGLFTLFHRYLLTQTRRCLEHSIRINVIGRRDRLSPALLAAIERSEQATAQCAGMRLRIAVDYSAQHSLLETCRRLQGEGRVDRESFLRALAAVDHSPTAVAEVDLLIRTGGEQRLSDFLLWECANSELYFVDRLWPDFDEEAFAAALDEYGRRDRRFGAVASPADEKNTNSNARRHHG